MEIQKTTTLRVPNMFKSGHEIRLNIIGKVFDPMVDINSDCQLEDEINEYIADKFESEEWSWSNMRLTMGFLTIPNGKYLRNKGYQVYIKLYNAVRSGCIDNIPLLANALLNADDNSVVDQYNEDVHTYCTGLIDHMLDLDLVDESVGCTDLG